MEDLKKERREMTKRRNIFVFLVIAWRKKDEEPGSQCNEKERQKIQATESLRKEMLYKIKETNQGKIFNFNQITKIYFNETKANLLALNDEQLQTTTRLTILQNQ